MLHLMRTSSIRRRRKNNCFGSKFKCWITNGQIFHSGGAPMEGFATKGDNFFFIQKKQKHYQAVPQVWIQIITVGIVINRLNFKEKNSIVVKQEY